MGVLLPKIPRGRQQQQQRDAIDFEMMRAANNGSYVEARRLLVEADRAQKVALHRHVEATLREGQKPKEVETIVRLSTTTGGPSLCNVQKKLTQKRSIPPPPVKESHRPVDARLADVKRNEEDRDARTRFLVVQEKRVNDAFNLSTGEHFRRGLESLGLDSKRGSFDETTEEKWWGIVEATDSFHSIIKEVCDAIDEDRMRRMRESEQRERCKMFLEDQYAKSYRERKFMHDEDYLTNYFHPLYGSTFLKMPPRHSFIPTSISLPKQHRAPPPPPWRIDGATGVPCEAPPLSRDCASRNSYRSLFTRDYVCNEAELVQCPAALSTTLHMQLGFDSLRLSRNQLPSILSLQLTCRKYVWVTASIYALLAGAYEMLTEMNCSRNKISTLPADIGICKRMRRIDLSNNHLHDLPATFTNMPRLADLNLRNNNFRLLPDTLGSLTTLVTLNVADNILERLPSTLPRIVGLQTLTVSGNSLISLAILRLVQELANTSVPESEVWHARTEPLTRRNYFHNVETGKTQRLLPAILGQARARRRAAQRLAIEGGGDEECYEHRRQRLAFQGVNEWSFSWSDAECCNIFTNAVSCEICTTMPDDLNTFGRLRSLTDLHVDHNRLRDLPDGIGQLKSLKKLVARENYIRVLPNSLGNLAKLEILDLGDNELDELPESTSALSSLELLVIQSNRFEKLPAFLGRLPALKMLRVGHNSLKTLPYEIGFADNLIQLQIYDNPLDEPSWYDSDLPKLKWYCRQKYWSLKNGPLPIVESTRVSICDEVFEPAPAHKMRVEKAIEDARETGILELQLQGVHEIPGACVERGKTRDDDEWFHPKLEGLQTLKMSMNAFSTGAPLFTKSLNKLRVLWLKDCCLTHIDDNIDNLQALRELVIESNAIYYLPSTFGRLRRLKKLNAAKNRLQWLPEGIFAKSLEYLDLSMNRLERVECVASLENLVDLSVACNHLFTLPLLHLPKLTRLNLDSNELRDLPPGLGDLPLVSLRVGHNRLERFAEDGVGPTLEYLGLANNNLLELPNSLPSRATSLRTLQVEHNPLRSPPAELASQGMAILKNYCDLRDTRMKSFEKMLTEYDFEFDAAHFSPQAFNVLVAGARTTGFLTKQDLEAFDASVDEYLNGPYYKFSATDVDIVEKIDAIRQERQHIFYNSMLQALIDTLRTQCEESVQKTRRLFGCGVLIETEKPWGRRGENVGVYALSLDALVHKTPKRQFVKEERTALFDLVKRRLPWSSFNTLETLKDAITKYEGPYGPVAHLDKVEFERCECVDERGRSKGHRKCVLPSLLVVKTIYTVGEAQRRVQEDDAIRSAWNTCWDEIDAALDTKLGKLMAQKEMFRREKNQGTRAKKLKAALADKRRQVRRASEFHQAALNRKKSYQQGGAFHFHRLESDSEAQRLVADAVRELDERTRELKETANELADVKMLAKAKKEVQLRNVAIDLKRKYCVLAYETIVDENRRRAFAHDWRRPWDGEDGIDFKKWSNAHSTALRSESSNLSTVPRWVSNLLNTRRTAGETDDDDDNPDKTFDYDWNGTDDMTQFFSNSRYSAFQEEQYALP